jgi:hypothetical protein
MGSEFEGKLLLFRLVLPMVLGSLAAWCFRYRLGQPGAALPQRQSWLRGAVGCLFVWGAFLLSDFASRGILLVPDQWSAWEAKERWMHWVWAGPLALSLWLLYTSNLKNSQRNNIGFAATMGGSMGLMAWAMFPDGPGYADQRVRFLLLSFLSLVAALLNVWMVKRRQVQTKGLWFGWVHVLHLGCVAAVVLQSYASLGEWVVFSGSMMAGVMLLLSLSNQAWAESILTPLLAFSSVAGLSLSQAYSWSPLPLALLVFLLVFPALAALLDSIVCKSTGEFTPLRVAVLVVTLGVLLGVLYGFVFQSEPQW